jgi:prevent-host-death family protein
MTVSIEQAQLRLADLLERVRQGEQIIITRNGETVARLVPDQPRSETPAPSPRDAWAADRKRLEAAGLKVPPPGAWNRAAVCPLVLEDGAPSASEMLVRDRR